MPQNPYNGSTAALGKILNLVYGIDNRPYDTVEILWTKVARSLGVTLSDYNDLEEILSRVVDAGGVPSGSSNPVYQSTPEDITNLVGLFAFSNSTGLPGVTELSVLASSNREGFSFFNCQDLLSLSFPNLVTLSEGAFCQIEQATSLASISFPLLSSVGADFSIINTAVTSLSFPSWVTPGNVSSSVTIFGNVGLVNFSFPQFIFRDGKLYEFRNNALSAASVNHILARGVASAAFVSGQLRLQGGTNAAPTGQGITDKATLIARGVTVTTN